MRKPIGLVRAFDRLQFHGTGVTVSSYETSTFCGVALGSMRNGTIHCYKASTFPLMHENLLHTDIRTVERVRKSSISLPAQKKGIGMSIYHFHLIGNGCNHIEFRV